MNQGALSVSGWQVGGITPALESGSRLHGGCGISVSSTSPVPRVWMTGAGRGGRVGGGVSF